MVNLGSLLQTRHIPRENGPPSKRARVESDGSEEGDGYGERQQQQQQQQRVERPNEYRPFQRERYNNSYAAGSSSSSSSSSYSSFSNQPAKSGEYSQASQRQGEESAQGYAAAARKKASRSIPTKKKPFDRAMNAMSRKGKEKEKEHDVGGEDEVKKRPSRVKELYNMHQQEFEEFMYGKTADTEMEGEEEGF